MIILMGHRVSVARKEWKARKEARETTLSFFRVSRHSLSLTYAFREIPVALE